MPSCRAGSVSHCLNVLAVLWVLITALPGSAQKRTEKAEDLPEMLVTREGFLAIDTPKGWVHSEGQDWHSSYAKA